MKKLLAILLLLCTVCLSASALAELPMVIDDAGLFTEAEIGQMETIITRIRNTYQIDAVVLTTRLSSMSDSALQDYADRYFEDNGYGLGSDASGFLFMIDMGNRYYHISTSGVMIDYLNDRRRDKVQEAVIEEMQDGNYAQAAIVCLGRMEIILQEGIEEGTFRYDSETGERLSGLYNALTLTELLVSLLAGAGAALLLILAVLGRYSLKSSTYHFDRATQSGVELTVDQERFLRRTVTRIKDPPPSSGGSGGGGGGGGGRGSAVHVSSGGGSHGGGGGHF